MRRTSWGVGAVWSSLVMMACNDHPLAPVDAVLTSATRTTVTLPARQKLDLLFVVDNSGSMAQEQANLTRNFGTLSRFLFDELGASSDFRIAVISTDLRDSRHRGRFVGAPARPFDPGRDSASACNPAVESSDCESLLVDPALDRRWVFGDVLRSGPESRGGNIGTTREDLERRFQCLATLGTRGDGFEKGLEAMRLALSCDGPNADRFGACCVDGEYDRNCASRLATGEEPVFLRPDALLVTVFLSDEVDCSDRASNPPRSALGICRTLEGADPMAAYADARLCPEGEPARCFDRECAGLSVEACRAARCRISREDLAGCEWYPDALTPVDEYVRFLEGLKVNPDRQLVVAAIVGPRALVSTPRGLVEPRMLPGRPAAACVAAVDLDCDASTPEETDPEGRRSRITPECCPDGRCTGDSPPACSSANGSATSGSRYLALADAFGENGVGCPVESTDGEARCFSICDEDFSPALTLVRDRIARLLGRYCLDRAPECFAPAGKGADAPLRGCESPAEFDDSSNYGRSIAVTIDCPPTSRSRGACEADTAPVALPDNAFEVVPEAACIGGFALELDAPAPPGARVRIAYRTEWSAGPR
jgi:hypothetical protein